jgi:hypothetical protein
VDSQPTIDPVLARRQQIKAWTKLGKRVGYSFLLLACVGFAYGLFVEFDRLAFWLVAIGLGASCVFLPPAIVFAYGVRSADKAERLEQCP